ncbi:CAP domain-containing protein [Streptomyces roseolus]|uniref:CAP domain-containing protein n=1 Tax=Streptomyces roseolus TaxID=67358 RepID=UPI003658E508
MQRTRETDRMAEWTTERIRAARYGDPWACEQVLGAHQPLVHALVSRALDARPDASAVDAVVPDTLLRAQGELHALPYPEVFRPWLVGLAVDTVLGHAAVGPDGGGGWLDIQDAVLAALASLEAEGLLHRWETAAALQWTPEDTAARMETVRTRAEAARSVDAALARRPRCPGLQELTAGWDGRPGAGWRDHLAQHTLWCALCGSAAPTGAAPTGVAQTVVVPSVVAPSAAAPAAGEAVPTAAYGGAGTDTAVAVAFAEEATRAYDLGGPAPAAPAGRRATRGDRRRRRQAEERTRRRAAVAAGIAVVAVTGGAFSLYGGGRDGRELLEANRAAAPGPDMPLTHDPDSLSATPADLGATPTASTASTAPPGRTTASATPRSGGKKTPTARPTTAAPTPQRTTAIPAPALPKKTAAPTTAAPEPAPTTASPTAGTDPAPGGGAQNDDGQGSAADQVLSLVNAERAKAGCGPLTANATLARAAQAHSDDMAARDFFDHTNPDGAGPGDRVTAAGYPWSTYGENIAMGQRTPEQVMEAWMNSPGHRANILNCDFKELGVGIHDGGGPYWTQVFGAR